MKASEMTNEELASKIATEDARDTVLFGYTKGCEAFGAICTEAAARLRKKCNTDGCFIAEAFRSDIRALRAKLKVAEDALGESRVAVCHICDQKHMCGHGTEKFDPCCIYKDIDNALATIRS